MDADPPDSSNAEEPDEDTAESNPNQNAVTQAQHARRPFKIYEPLSESKHVQSQL